MRSIAIMQPYLFPYIGYFHLMQAVDIFVLFDDVNFIKKGWINRNNILLEDQAYSWTLPLSKASQNRLINEHKIFESELSKVKLLNLFERAYRKAPYYEAVFPILSKILQNEEVNIAKFIRFSLEELSAYMGLQTHFVFSSDLKKDKDLPAQERIMQMIQSLNGTRYCNAIGGQELYDRKAFASKDIELCFVRSNSIGYKQWNQTFTPFLSIVDVLMFNDHTEIKKHLCNYELV